MEQTTLDFISCKITLTKLNNVKYILKRLQKKINSKSENEIFPLTNYILILLDSPLFNINPSLGKRFDDLCQYQLKERNEFNDISSNVSNLNIPYKFSKLPSIKNCEIEKQITTLTFLQSLIDNTILSYSKQLETFKNIPQQVEDAIAEILKCNEMNILFKLAIDTQILSNSEARSLQLEIIKKFLAYLELNVLPNLLTFCKKIEFSVKNLHSVPLADSFLSQSIYKSYASLITMLHVWIMVSNLVRYFQNSNEEYLNERKTKLFADNIESFESFIRALNLNTNIFDLMEKAKQFQFAISSFISIESVNFQTIKGIYNDLLLKQMKVLVDEFQLLKECSSTMSRLQYNESKDEEKFSSLEKDDVELLLIKKQQEELLYKFKNVKSFATFNDLLPKKNLLVHSDNNNLAKENGFISTNKFTPIKLKRVVIEYPPKHEVPVPKTLKNGKHVPRLVRVKPISDLPHFKNLTASKVPESSNSNTLRLKSNTMPNILSDDVSLSKKVHFSEKKKNIASSLKKDEINSRTALKNSSRSLVKC